MLPVVALSSPPLPWILMGSSSGNRFPVLASSDINLSSTLAPHPREGAIFRGGKKGTGGLYHEKREQSRWFIYLGNIPDTGMLPGWEKGCINKCSGRSARASWRKAFPV